MSRFTHQLFWGMHRQELLHCSHCRGVARIIDSWAWVFVILNNVLSTSAILHRATSTSVPMILLPALAFVGWSCLQRYVSHRWPDFYYRNHTWILLCNRLMRCPMLPLLIRETRTRCRDPTLPTQLELYLTTARPFATPPTELFTSTLAISGSLMLLMHATAAPLPFVPHLALQAACVAVMLLCQSLPAAFFIETSPLRATGHAACLRMNALLANSSSVFGIYSNRQLLRAACDRHSSQLLVTFAQLYFGGVLPICFSYRLQSHLRQYLAAMSLPAGSSRSRGGGSGRGSGRARGGSGTEIMTDIAAGSSRSGRPMISPSVGEENPLGSPSGSSQGSTYGDYTSGGHGSSNEASGRPGCPSPSNGSGNGGGTPSSPSDSDAGSVGGVSGLSADGGPLAPREPTHETAPASSAAVPPPQAEGWPYQADSLRGVLMDLLVLAYLVPACWVCALLLRPVLSTVAWPVAV